LEISRIWYEKTFPARKSQQPARLPVRASRMRVRSEPTEFVFTVKAGLADGGRLRLKGEARSQQHAKQPTARHSQRVQRAVRE
jgi:hypothetical protein